MMSLASVDETLETVKNDEFYFQKPGITFNYNIGRPQSEVVFVFPLDISKSYTIRIHASLV